ncbi:MAG: peptidoglycan-associated lipoprotein [Gammaproteobacteria bacterium]|nr:MAG: peptidoglycan-associated lipoprotein [Gammaproteobacteria bacterium]RLA21916.1 MAG: peptidoglycan-associated lipoprotein [Gammaproteobacteria bacterium]
MKSVKAALFIFIGVFVLSGCGTTGSGESGPTDGEGGAGNGYDSGASTTGIDGGETYGAGAYAGNSVFDPANPRGTRVIKFAFDSSEVAAEYLPVVAAHAEYLVANPDKSVVLEAHADERGSREYNIALSEHRGNSVADLMKFQSVSPNQVQVMSYGEEKPLSYGHDELSWEQNRRVEIIYFGE